MPVFPPSTRVRGAIAVPADYADKPLEKPLKLVLKVGGSEVTELSGSGHDSSYYDDRSDHERERHREKKKKKKKKSEKEKYLDDEERRKRKVKARWPRTPEGRGGVQRGLRERGPVWQSPEREGRHLASGPLRTTSRRGGRLE